MSSTSLRFRFLGGLALSLLTPLVFAGGPLSVCANVATKYAGAGTVTLNYDLGNFGSRSKAQVDALVTEAVSLWTNVPTSTVTLARGNDVSVDITSSNFLNYIGSGTYNDGLNPVVYDTDGSILDALLGVGARNSVLGFAGSAWYNYTTHCQYAEGRAVINGYLAVSDTTLKTIVAHEVGHLIGMDHTQLDNTQGLSSSNYPLMYPIAYRTLISLHEDDMAAVSALYPDGNLGSVYGQLTGAFTQVNGTPIRGANIWARENTTGKLYSVASDYLRQNTGHFKLLLPAGTYTLRAEAIQTNFTGGSSVGPYSELSSDPSFQSPIYVGGVAMTPITLGNGTPTPITITAGCAATATFRTDGTGGVSGNCAIAPPAVPTAIAPSGTVSSTTPTYSWNAVAGATTYWLYVGTNAGAVVSISYSASSLGCATGTGTCTITPSSALVNGTSYSWFVLASNSAGNSPWSNGLIFKVSTTSVPAAPMLVSPSGTVSSTTPTYSWNAVAGATTYWLYVGTNAGAVVSISYSASSLGCATGTGTCTITPSSALVNGTSYSWFVLASNSAGNSPWSNGLIFTTP